VWLLLEVGAVVLLCMLETVGLRMAQMDLRQVLMEQMRKEGEVRLKLLLEQVALLLAAVAIPPMGRLAPLATVVAAQ